MLFEMNMIDQVINGVNRWLGRINTVFRALLNLKEVKEYGDFPLRSKFESLKLKLGSMLARYIALGGYSVTSRWDASQMPPRAIYGGLVEE